VVLRKRNEDRIKRRMMNRKSLMNNNHGKKKKKSSLMNLYNTIFSEKSKEKNKTIKKERFNYKSLIERRNNSKPRNNSLESIEQRKKLAKKNSKVVNGIKIYPDTSGTGGSHHLLQKESKEGNRDLKNGFTRKNRLKKKFRDFQTPKFEETNLLLNELKQPVIKLELNNEDLDWDELEDKIETEEAAESVELKKSK